MNGDQNEHSEDDLNKNGDPTTKEPLIRPPLIRPPLIRPPGAPTPNSTESGSANISGTNPMLGAEDSVEGEEKEVTSSEWNQGGVQGAGEGTGEDSITLEDTPEGFVRPQLQSEETGKTGGKDRGMTDTTAHPTSAAGIRGTATADKVSTVRVSIPTCCK